MIDTIITFAIGVWFGGTVGFIIAGLLAASRTDFYFWNNMDYPMDKTREVKMIPVINIKATGERIKTMMDERELVVKDIQEELGLATVQAVYKWFYGQNLPSLDNLICLSHVFQVKIDDILVLEERG